MAAAARAHVRTVPHDDVDVDVDLDALRRAGADGRRTKTFRLDGITYEVAGKLPMYVAILLGKEDLEGGMRLWLGDDQFDTAMKADLTDEEFGALFKGLYGATPGESGGSAG